MWRRVLETTATEIYFNISTYHKTSFRSFNRDCFSHKRISVCVIFYHQMQNDAIYTVRLFCVWRQKYAIRQVGSGFKTVSNSARALDDHYTFTTKLAVTWFREVSMSAARLRLLYDVSNMRETERWQHTARGNISHDTLCKSSTNRRRRLTTQQSNWRRETGRKRWQQWNDRQTTHERYGPSVASAIDTVSPATL